MKKIFTLIALLTSVVGFAQTNVLLSGTFSTNGNGEIGSNWWSYLTVDDVPAYVQYDFDEAVTFDQVEIAFRDVQADEFTIAYGDDSDALTEVPVTLTTEELPGTNGDGSNANAYTFTFTEAVTVKVFKLIITHNVDDNGIATLSSLKAFNSAAPKTLEVAGNDSWGFVQYSGTLNADTKGSLVVSDETVVGVNLTNVTIEDGVTVDAFANPNTLVLITEEQTDAATAAGLSNLVRIANTQWLGALSDLSFNANYAFYDGTQRTTWNVNDGWIDVSGYAITYTVTLPASSWSLYNAPYTLQAEELPAGVYAYGITSFDADANALATEKLVTLDQYKPVLLLNTNADATDLTVSGTGNFYQFNGNGNSTQTISDDITVQAALYPVAADGTQYGLGTTAYTEGETELSVAALSGTIATGSAYILLSENITDLKITVSDEGLNDDAEEGDDNDDNEGEGTEEGGDATSISSVSVDNAADAPIYNLNGVRVKNLSNGIYILNGKKVVVK